MALNYYTIGNQLIDYQNSKNFYENALKGLENVKRETTKAGKDFAVFSKNFTGCKISNGFIEGERFLTVYFHTNRGYDSYRISLYDGVQNIKEYEGKALIYRGGMVPAYQLTVNESFQRINKNIETIKSYIAYYETKINQFKEVENILKHIDQIVSESKYNSDLRELLRKGVISA